MSEQVKVFKNVHTQTATGAAHSVTLASTSSTQKAVIKSVDCNGVGNATLDLDGRTIATGTTDLVASGNLIMDNSSTLSLKFPVISGVPGVTGFNAMIFSNGTDSRTLIKSDTTTIIPATKVNHDSGQSMSASAAFAYNKTTGPEAGLLCFYRYWSGNVYAWTEAGSIAGNPFINGTSFGSGHSMCTDGTYMYNVGSGSGQTSVNRRHLETNANSNFNTNTSFDGQQGNQGCWLLYHNGFLYSKRESSTQVLDKIDVQYNADGTEGSTFGNVTRYSDGQFNSGSYSNGGAIVTNTAGESYVMEMGDGYWWYFKISNGTVNRESGSGSSTEYGNGGFEISPGIFVCLGEQSDRFDRVDMNVSPPVFTVNSGTNPYLVNGAIGDSFAVAYEMKIADPARSYGAYTSGVLITEDT